MTDGRPPGFLCYNATSEKDRLPFLLTKLLLTLDNGAAFPRPKRAPSLHGPQYKLHLALQEWLGDPALGHGVRSWEQSVRSSSKCKCKGSYRVLHAFLRRGLGGGGGNHGHGFRVRLQQDYGMVFQLVTAQWCTTFAEVRHRFCQRKVCCHGHIFHTFLGIADRLPLFG